MEPWFKTGARGCASPDLCPWDLPAAASQRRHSSMARIHSMTIEAPITKVRSFCLSPLNRLSSGENQGPAAVPAPFWPWSPSSGERMVAGTAGWSWVGPEHQAA